MSGQRERWLALMPLRGGSRAIPDKNILPMAGRPLFVWALQAALDSGCFDEVCVASDSDRIRHCVRSWCGNAVTVLDRSAASASDDAATEQVMLEVAERAPFDVMALVQATSPLTQARDFVGARQRFVESALDSLVTGVASRRFFWSSAGLPLNYQPAERPRRQDMAPSYEENGAFYFTRRSVLLEQRCRLGGRIGVHPMHPDTLTEIDEPEDWPVVERLLRRRTITERLRRLQVLVVDVDGTLTDGGMYYGAEGERLKRFNTRDAKGLALLAGAGVRVCVMTGERSPAVDARMRKLGIRDYFPGTADKRELLEKYLAELALEPETAGVIGDDVADLEAMQLARVSFCPADAVAAVQAQADYVCSAAGGQGAVREVCDLILQARAATDPQQAS